MNRIYFHIAKLGNYQEICSETFEFMKKSGILKDSEIYLSIVGVGDDIKTDLEYKVEYQSDNVIDGEIPILMRMKNFAINSFDNVNILYIHTKGASTPNNICIDDWRRYMLYFNVTKYEDCLNILNNYDVCGVDLRNEPVKHYSGNFWWSNTEHIKKLPEFEEMKTVISERHKSEFWVCSIEGNYYSMHDCGINQYQRHLHRYEESKYKK